MPTEDTNGNDDGIWQSYARRVKRTPKPKAVTLAKKPRLKPHDPDKAEAKAAAVRITVKASPVTPAQKNPQPQTVFDRKTEKQWRTGDFGIEGKIDLHGMTQTQAYNALAKFLANQYKRGHRKLLVITGKGGNDPARGTGILRASLPHWLETLDQSPFILTVRQAALKHGGDGAFYIILKKPR